MRLSILLLAGCGTAAGPMADGPGGDPMADGPAPDLLGAPCVREADCPDGLACRLERIDDGDGVPESVAATCLPENDVPARTGDACVSDDECRTGFCHLGICSELCTQKSCPEGHSCNDVTSIAGGWIGPASECPPAAQAPRVSACLPRIGVLDVALADATHGQWTRLDVPSQAVSVTMMVQTDLAEVFVGVSALRAPDGSALYDLPFTQPEFLAQPIRYFPTDRISTMLVPNTPDVAFLRGTHCFRFYAEGGATLRTRARIKMAPGGAAAGGTLDLAVHILDLSGMGCGVDGLTAGSAATHMVMQDALGGAAGIFSQAGITLGAVSYDDIVGRPDLDVIDSLDGPDGDGVYEELNALLSEGTGTGDSVDIFLVRHIEGPVAIAGSIPGPPGAHALPHAGVAISMEAPCTTSLAKVLAHEVAHWLGLFHNIDSDGPDPIDDTDEGTANLMYATSLGTDLTAGQVFVLRAHPAVR